MPGQRVPAHRHLSFHQRLPAGNRLVRGWKDVWSHLLGWNLPCPRELSQQLLSQWPGFVSVRVLWHCLPGQRLPHTQRELRLLCGPGSLRGRGVQGHRHLPGWRPLFSRPNPVRGRLLWSHLLGLQLPGNLSPVHALSPRRNPVREWFLWHHLHGQHVQAGRHLPSLPQRPGILQGPCLSHA